MTMFLLVFSLFCVMPSQSFAQLSSQSSTQSSLVCEFGANNLPKKVIVWNPMIDLYRLAILALVEWSVRLGGNIVANFEELKKRIYDRDYSLLSGLGFNSSDYKEIVEMLQHTWLFERGERIVAWGSWLYIFAYIGSYFINFLDKIFSHTRTEYEIAVLNRINEYKNTGNISEVVLSVIRDFRSKEDKNKPVDTSLDRSNHDSKHNESSSAGTKDNTIGSNNSAGTKDNTIGSNNKDESSNNAIWSGNKETGEKVKNRAEAVECYVKDILAVPSLFYTNGDGLFGSYKTSDEANDSDRFTVYELVDAIIKKCEKESCIGLNIYKIQGREDEMTILAALEGLMGFTEWEESVVRELMKYNKKKYEESVLIYRQYRMAVIEKILKCYYTQLKNGDSPKPEELLKLINTIVSYFENKNTFSFCKWNGEDERLYGSFDDCRAVFQKFNSGDVGKSSMSKKKRKVENDSNKKNALEEVLASGKDENSKEYKRTKNDIKRMDRIASKESVNDAIVQFSEKVIASVKISDFDCTLFCNSNVKFDLDEIVENKFAVIKYDGITAFMERIKYFICNRKLSDFETKVVSKISDKKLIRDPQALYNKYVYDTIEALLRDEIVVLKDGMVAGGVVAMVKFVISYFECDNKRIIDGLVRHLRFAMQYLGKTSRYVDDTEDCMKALEEIGISRFSGKYEQAISGMKLMYGGMFDVFTKSLRDGKMLPDWYPKKDVALVTKLFESKKKWYLNSVVMLFESFVNKGLFRHVDKSKDLDLSEYEIEIINSKSFKDDFGSNDNKSNVQVSSDRELYLLFRTVFANEAYNAATQLLGKDKVEFAEFKKFAYSYLSTEHKRFTPYLLQHVVSAYLIAKCNDTVAGGYESDVVDKILNGGIGCTDDLLSFKREMSCYYSDFCHEELERFVVKCIHEGTQDIKEIWKKLSIRDDVLIASCKSEDVSVQIASHILAIFNETMVLKKAYEKEFMTISQLYGGEFNKMISLQKKDYDSEKYLVGNDGDAQFDMFCLRDHRLIYCSRAVYSALFGKKSEQSDAHTMWRLDYLMKNFNITLDDAKIQYAKWFGWKLLKCVEIAEKETGIVCVEHMFHFDLVTVLNDNLYCLDDSLKTIDLFKRLVTYGKFKKSLNLAPSFNCKYDYVSKIEYELIKKSENKNYPTASELMQIGVV